MLRCRFALHSYLGGEMTEGLMAPVADSGDGVSASRTVRRWVATGVVASLATAMVGFLAGRASAPADDSLVSAGGADTSVPATVTPTAPAVTPTAPAEAPSADTVASAGHDVAGSTGTGTFEGDRLGAYPDAPMTPLSERTTADGILIRVLRMDQPVLDGDLGYPGGEWSPAAWCFPSGSVRIELVTSSAAQVAWGSIFASDAEFPKAQTFTGGYAQNTPFYGIGLQVEGTVATARFVANGATDEAPVIDGVVVLAVPGPIDAGFEVTLLDPTGTTEVLTEDDLTTQIVSDRYLEECTPPPPALPDAGESPADPAAARAAVESSFDAAYAQDGTGLEFIDDPTGVQAARDRVGASTYAETAAAAVLEIDELVFTSPTEAWFRYSIHADVSSFANRYGIARQAGDGVWRITRATVCQDLALIPDGGCEPAAEPILPPDAMIVPLGD